MFVPLELRIFVNNSISRNRFYGSFKPQRVIEQMYLYCIGVSCCRSRGAVSEYFNIYVTVIKVVVIAVYIVVFVVVVRTAVIL